MKAPLMKSPQIKLRRRKARLPFVFCLFLAALPLAAQERAASLEELLLRMADISQAEVNSVPAQGEEKDEKNSSLTIITLPSKSSISAEEKTLIKELFETTKFADVEMTMDVRDGGDHVRSFIPKTDSGAEPSIIYMLVVSKTGHVAMKLTGSYALSASLNVSPEEREAK